MKKYILNILLVLFFITSVVGAVLANELTGYWFLAWVCFVGAYASALGLIKLNTDWLEETP